jgi:hypothetical protein
MGRIGPHDACLGRIVNVVREGDVRWLSGFGAGALTATLAIGVLVLTPDAHPMLALVVMGAILAASYVTATVLLVRRSTRRIGFGGLFGLTACLLLEGFAVFLYIAATFD